MDVGFIGLGAMGKAMAANLIKAGHRVRVWNRSRAAVSELVAQGAIAADRAKDCFRGDAVISILADDDATRAVVLADGVLDGAAEGIVHVNMATVSVAFAKALAAEHARRGIAYVGAPVFGRTEIAVAAKLHIIAAGPPAAIAHVQPLFDALGQKTWRFGDEPWRANVVKIAGNFLIGSAIEAMAETAALSKAHGIAPADLLGMLTSTLFASPVYQGYGTLIAEERYEPAAFRLVLGLKDVRLTIAAGEDASVPMPIASVLHDALVDAVAHGDGERDWVALAKVALRRAGLDGPHATTGSDLLPMTHARSKIDM